jgi:hypothetical protein
MLTFIAGCVVGTTLSFLAGGLCLAASNGDRKTAQARADEAYREQLLELMYRRRNADITYDGDWFDDDPTIAQRFVQSGTLHWN